MVFWLPRLELVFTVWLYVLSVFCTKNGAVGKVPLINTGWFRPLKDKSYLSITKCYLNMARIM